MKNAPSLAVDSKKLLLIPVKPHVYKMLVRDYDYEGLLHITKRLHLYSHTNTQFIKDWYEIKTETKIIIQVLMPRGNRKKGYAMAKAWEAEFKEKLHFFIKATIAAGGPKGNAKSAIRRFFDMYDLSEEDYKEECAYKSWQRFAKTPNEKDSKRLWA